MYPQGIEKLTRLVPSMFPDGLSLLQSSLFCFGPHADDIKVLKIHKANNKTQENLDKSAGVDNIGEERNVNTTLTMLTLQEVEENFWNLHLAMLQLNHPQTCLKMLLQENSENSETSQQIFRKSLPN